MVDADQILAFVDAVARFCRPRQIVLFGSYGYGQPTGDSDVDLLIVMPHTGASHRQATRIRLNVEVDFPLDLLVRTPDEIERRLAWNDFFLKEIFERGIVLYDAVDQRMGRQGRRRLRDRAEALALA
jgi:predicted nucleotidyltransferase